MDAYLYLISASYVSGAKYKRLADDLIAAAPCFALAVRLEAEGDAMWTALDQLVVHGASRIELRPIGLPFSQSLETWLPGAAGSWLARQGGDGPELYFAQALQTDPAVVRSAAWAQVTLKAIAPKPDGEIGKGWDRPPAFRHHLLVCAGPRCHLKDAPHLVDSLKAELGRRKISAQCLVTTTGCLFPCNNGPVIVHYPRGDWYRVRSVSEVKEFVSRALCAGDVPHHLRIHQTGEIHEPA